MNGTRECQSLNGYVKLGIEGRQRQLQSGIGFNTSGGNRIRYRACSGKEGRKSKVGRLFMICDAVPMFPQGPSGLGAVWLPWFVRLMAFDGGTALVRLLPGIQGVRGNIYFRVLISRSSSSAHLQSSSSSSWDSWLLGSYQFPPLLTKIQFQEVDTAHKGFQDILPHTRASRRFYHTQGYPGVYIGKIDNVVLLQQPI